MIKVDIISGFLGAGKTTVIKKLLDGAFVNEKVVLIENEFGEIGIDSSFLKESGVKIREMNAGCICCSLVGDFSESLKDVIQLYTPERIIIEPSGVGKLSDIIAAIQKVEANLSLNIVATVVDGAKAQTYLKNFGEFFEDQIKTANTILISKIDKIDSNKAKATLELCKELNKEASIITTPVKDINAEKLLIILEEGTSIKNKMLTQLLAEHHEHGEDCGCEHHHEHGEDCGCGHHHEHGEDCGCEHHHEHGEDCGCGHHHEHDEDCGCGHHHEHGEDCGCGHHHEHGEDCGCGHHHEHTAEDVFMHLTLETVVGISKDELNQFLNELSSEFYGVILRSKGVLKASDHDDWYYFDYVSGDYEIRLGSPDFASRLILIGTNLKEQELKDLFEKRGK